MLIKEAKEIARQWVFEEGSKLPGFYGAYFAGSTNWKADDELFPLVSDMDLKVVIDGEMPPHGYRKLAFHNVLLEISYAPSSDYQSPETILGIYHAAKHFTTPNIIADPSGQLAKIQKAVAEAYPRREWVRKRCEHNRSTMEQTLQWFNPSAPLHDQVFAWLYPCSNATHMLAVADLRNPTIRQMFIVAQNVLAKYGRLDFHEIMLERLGSAKLNREQVESLLTSCAEALDLAGQFVKTPFFGTTNITDYARPTVVDGIREMIERGYPREAVFWIITNHSWCQKALYNDAPGDVQAQAAPSYQQLLSAIGMNSADDIVQRHEALKSFVLSVWEVAETILDINPDIID